MPSKRKATTKKFAPRVKKVLNSLLEEKAMINNNCVTAQPIKGDAWFIANLLCSQDATLTDQAGSGIVQGNGDDERIGARIRLKKIDINFEIRPTVAQVEADGSACRLLLVHDRNPTLGYPSGTDIMTSASILAQQNQTNKKRFTILKDIVHQMTWIGTKTADTIASAGPQLLGKFTIYPKYELAYNSGSGLTANITNHCWYVIAINDQIGSVNSCCSFLAITKVTYTDA